MVAKVGQWLRLSGVVIGVLGGLICILGGAVSIGVAMFEKELMIPRGFFWALGLYFLGKGAFAIGLSLNVGADPARSST